MEENIKNANTPKIEMSHVFKSFGRKSILKDFNLNHIKIYTILLSIL